MRREAGIESVSVFVPTCFLGLEARRGDTGTG
jgi:hypothetical protein